MLFSIRNVSVFMLLTICLEVFFLRCILQCDRLAEKITTIPLPCSLFKHSGFFRVIPSSIVTVPLSSFKVISPAYFLTGFFTWRFHRFQNSLLSLINYVRALSLKVLLCKDHPFHGFLSY